ncbi:MAG: TIGR04463 family radical SAM/SPASM RiPP maturase [Cyanobacteria bacterium J06555_13]
MKASSYNIFVPLKKGRVLAYNSLSGASAVWDSEDKDTYQRVVESELIGPAEPNIKNLAYGGYLVDDHIDELALLEKHYHANRFNPQVMTLTIAPTLSCNFGCDYCFQGQDKPADVMGPEVQDAILALVKRAAPGIKQLGVAWYGGEPLLKPKIIEALSKRFIALCDRNKIDYSAMIVTNGYYLDLDMARSLYTHRVKTVQVTLDGIPQYHDQRRALLSGKPTFNRIVDNLKSIVDEVPISISIRVNIDHRNRKQIVQLLDLLDERGLSHRDNFKLYFAPIESMTKGCHLVEEATMGKADYGQLEAELYRYGYEKGLTQLPYPPRYHGTCAAVKPKGMVITPKGTIHKCWDTVTNPLYAVGSIFDIDSFNQSESMKDWLRWTPFANKTCRNCKILPNCAGACAYKFIHADETRGEAAVLPCPSWKYNINERLILRAEKTGHITADDYHPEDIRTETGNLCTEIPVSGGNTLPESMLRSMPESMPESMPRKLARGMS